MAIKLSPRYIASLSTVSEALRNCVLALDSVAGELSRQEEPNDDVLLLFDELRSLQEKADIVKEKYTKEGSV